MEVIVLDSASSDGSGTMVQQSYPQVKLIRSEINLGFAKGNNEALKQATGRFILLLNPDTIVHEQAIELLSEALQENSHLGVVGGQLLNRDGSLQHSNGVFPSLLSETPLLNRLKQMRAQPALEGQGSMNNGLVPVDWVSGACLMSRREVIETVGLLDEAFWLYTEEADFCYRVQQAGWGVATVRDAIITHFGQAASRQRYRETMLYFYQSRVRFVAKHQGTASATIVMGILAAKAQVWQRVPSRSPLYRAYGSLIDQREIAGAYQQLFGVMTMPLAKLLNCKWE